MDDDFCPECGHLTDRFGYLVVCSCCGYEEIDDLETFFEMFNGDYYLEDYEI